MVLLIYNLGETTTYLLLNCCLTTAEIEIALIMIMIIVIVTERGVMVALDVTCSRLT